MVGGNIMEEGYPGELTGPAVGFDQKKKEIL